MLNLEIDFTDIKDLKKENNQIMLDDIKKVARSTLEKGGNVKIKRSYLNSPDDIVKYFPSIIGFDDWWDSVVL